jgi:hypothetical protein
LSRFSTNDWLARSCKLGEQGKSVITTCLESGGAISVVLITLDAVAADASHQALHFQHADGGEDAWHRQAAAVDDVVDDTDLVADCGDDGLLLRVEL